MQTIQTSAFCAHGVPTLSQLEWWLSPLCRVPAFLRVIVRELPFWSANARWLVARELPDTTEGLCTPMLPKRDSEFVVRLQAKRQDLTRSS